MKKLYVGNLSFNTNEDSLNAAFGAHGRLQLGHLDVGHAYALECRFFSGDLLRFHWTSQAKGACMGSAVVDQKVARSADFNIASP